MIFELSFKLERSRVFKYIVTGMSEPPGRKSVILFSDGFVYAKRRKRHLDQVRFLDFLQQLVDRQIASVVFYTVDARG